MVEKRDYPVAANTEPLKQQWVDSVVIALDAADTKHVLLTQQPNGDWALPCGLVPNKEALSPVAEQEIWNQTGLEADQVATHTFARERIPHPYDDDAPNVDAVAKLAIIHAAPDYPNSNESPQTRWFPLTEVDFLEDKLGRLPGDHGTYLSRANEQIETFNLFMRRGQKLHGLGRYRMAELMYSHAAETLPMDPLSSGRALRGEAASINKQGSQPTASKKVEAALALHYDVLDASMSGSQEAQSKAAREWAQTAGVLGRITLAPIVKQELGKTLTTAEARQQAQTVLEYMEGAHDTISLVEIMTNVPDQYRINILSHLAVAQSLYGDVKQGRENARQAAWLGKQSEARSNATSADMSAFDRFLAKNRAIIRGRAAQAVNGLTRLGGSFGRRVALRIAQGKKLGL